MNFRRASSSASSSDGLIWVMSACRPSARAPWPCLRAYRAQLECPNPTPYALPTLVPGGPPPNRYRPLRT
jgi:hypothetical protein